MGKYELRSKKRQKKSDDEAQDDPKKLRTHNSTESLKKILDLNDDCLDEIFGYLGYDDVLSACQVCLRFENRARDVFKRKNYDVHVFSVKANASKNLLCRIGPALSKLEIFFCADDLKNQQTIDAATKYCVENLTELTLNCLTNRNKLRKSFSRVNKLTLSFCNLIGRLKLIKWFPNVTNLTFYYTKNLTKFMNQNIPSMHTLNINYLTSYTETITMLLSNPQIKNLSLNFDSRKGMVIKRKLLAAIDEALPELHALNLIIDHIQNFGAEDLSLHFKNLKSLKLENYSDYGNTELINVLAISQTNLERLELRFSDLANDSDSYGCIAKYKNLRVLKLMPVRRSLDVNVVLMLIHQLPLLEKIEQTVDFANVVPWTADEVTNFLRGSKQLMEMAFIFVDEAQIKFSRTLDFIQTQFIGSEWIVKTEERFGSKTFGRYGVDIIGKELVISIIKGARPT